MEIVERPMDFSDAKARPVREIITGVRKMMLMLLKDSLFSSFTKA